MADTELEKIFSYAVAMEQSGRMKNTILCGSNEIYIINFDRTVLLSFILSKQSGEFKTPISFDANDYDGSNFYVEDGQVVFETQQDGYLRKKKCGSGAKDIDFEQVSDLYLKRSRKKT